jgi:putative transposase
LRSYQDRHYNIFIVMPIHIHGLISLQEFKRAGTIPTPTKPFTLSEIVRAFNNYSSRRINQLRHTPGVHIWQRGYYEHIIQSEIEYHQIGEYILFNPSKWESDRENPNTNLK